ncbi:MAG: hypothetical protein NC253_15730 [Ruminococcus sp.]|nr:hypothetical protein [Ruminococcus sp.]MCM1382296.1 hypothetical protein [Muribaculaceae bacterium]MCM1480673.1 hypothetical protein [Muribaculaceae bacterium]
MENFSKRFLIKMPNDFGDGKGYNIRLYNGEKDAAVLETDGDTYGFEVIADVTGNDFYSDRAVAERGGKLLTFEVERRWLVKIPQNIEDFPHHVIEQAYLPPEGGFQGRIRRLDGRFIYTEKARTGSSVTRIENEREITEEEYNEYKKRTILNIVKKKRYIIPFGGLTFEFDVFENTVESGYGIMEAELPNEAADCPIPDFVEVVKEVTEDGYYTNRHFAEMDKICLIKQGV